MWGASSIKPDGVVTVSTIGDAIIESRGFGYLRRPAVETAQSEIEKILLRHDGSFDSLFDGSEITGFEIGLPMFWVRWSLPMIHRFRRFAVVGRAGPMLSVARPFQYLLPTLSVGLFENRDEALSFLTRKTPER